MTPMHSLRKIFHSTLMICVLTLITGCIHYYPVAIDGEEGKDPTKVSVAIQLEISPTLSLAAMQSRQAVSGALYQLFIIEFSRKGTVVAHREACIRVEETQDANEITLPFEIPLHALEYDVSVWSDYCNDLLGLTAPYDASSLTPLISNMPYVGNSELKICHYASTSIDLRPYRESWDYHHKLSISLEKAVAKYQILTTDIKAFLTNNSTDSLRVSVEYNDYHPLGYNVVATTPEMYSDRVAFSCAVATTDVDANGELCLAFDYIFVPPNEERSTHITLVVEDGNGARIVKYDNIEISYRAGKITTLYGKFLTQSSSSGIGVNLDWDDEIIIVI